MKTLKTEEFEKIRSRSREGIKEKLIAYLFKSDLKDKFAIGQEDVKNIVSKDSIARGYGSVLRNYLRENHLNYELRELVNGEGRITSFVIKYK